MSNKHTHKYFYGKRVGRTPIWSCALPGCTHYMPNHMKDMLDGKFSLCWKCGEEFVLDPALMKNPKPVCYDCIGLGGIIEGMKVQEDPIMKASQARIERFGGGSNSSSNESVTTEPIPGVCKVCGEPTLTPGATMCAPCMFK